MNLSEKNASFYRKRWLIFAPAGLILVGAGLSVLSVAAFMKRDGKPLSKWFWWGTGSLVLVNSGISLVGQAVKYNTLAELAEE